MFPRACATVLFTVTCLLWKMRKSLLRLNSCDCTISAPGKVLIAGGYTILDDDNVGVAIAVTSRFFTSIIKQISNNDQARLVIEVESPQFGESYEYFYDWNRKQLFDGRGTSNEFIGKCLLLVLTFSFYFNEKHLKLRNLTRIHKLKIKLRADNDFYSRIHDLQANGDSLSSESLKRFPKFFVPLNDDFQRKKLSKTGLGSSAALTSSLVGALLHATGVVDMIAPNSEMLRVIHNLAQLAHALAQGKIGSGFDVSAAIYGSQLYSRFSASNIDALSVIRNDGSCDDEMLFCIVMQPTIWNQTITNLSLPPHIDIVLGDVCGGSSSTSMARAVLKWRDDRPVEAGRLWKQLVDANNRICEYLLELNNRAKVNRVLYDTIFSQIEKVHVSDLQKVVIADVKGCEIINILLELKKQFSIARLSLKQIGEEAGVGIEPDQQTHLLNATENLDGVLCAGVPGAGGVDAVFALTLSENGRRNIERLWSSYTENNSAVCPLLLRSADALSGIKYEKNINY